MQHGATSRVAAFLVVGLVLLFQHGESHEDPWVAETPEYTGYSDEDLELLSAMDLDNKGATHTTHAKKSKKHHHVRYVKGANKLRSKIHKALHAAAKALSAAKTPAEKAAAKLAVKRSLADAGLADADNAGTIAWANKNIKQAKKWAHVALKMDAHALGKVAAWQPGDRKVGIAMRHKAESAIKAMIAVASNTKNAEMVAREDKLRAEGKLKSYDAPIKNAREASKYAAKSVEHARAALEATMGTRARFAAKHALIRAQEAVKDANNILKMEVGKKSAITSNRLQSDGVKLVGESELHYRARKTFHRANRTLKQVNKALAKARKNHYAHKEAMMKQTQKSTREKAAKLAHAERRSKSEARRKALGIKTKEQYAAHLAAAALKYGKEASRDAKKAAKEGKIAAEKALESANVKAELSHKPTSTAVVSEALHRENIAADLAMKAYKMEDAIVTGGKIPKEVETLLENDEDGNPMQAARHAAQDAGTTENFEEDFEQFVAEKQRWKKHYEKLYKDKLSVRRDIIDN